MDHNLDDSLNLEGAIGVDFGHSEDTVVKHDDISLNTTGHGESIPMEYENIEEQSMMMDTGNEEIIVSDFMGDQFSLQEYGAQEVQVSSENTMVEVEENEIVMSSSQSGGILGLCEQPIAVRASGVIKDETYSALPKIISVKAAPSGARAAPRPVAIAPRPAKVVTQGVVQKVALGPGKQYAIAPKPLRPSGKPVTLVSSLSNKAIHKPAKPQQGNAVLSIGRQLVMMPGGQRLKLEPCRLQSSKDDSAQLIQTVPTSQAQGNKVLKKVIVQGSGVDVNQPAVITKLVSAPPARLVALQKNPGALPITIGNRKVVLASPTRQGVRYSAGSKPQLVAIKPPALAPATAPHAQQGITRKVVTVAANSTHNVVLKAAPKSGMVTSISSGQKTQLHQINVPGKGIQYIRLVTNPSAGGGAGAGAGAARAARQPAPPTKTFVIADGKGNLIQMTTEKVTQPPPLVVTGTVTTSQQGLLTLEPHTNSASTKPPHKLVRLAPVSSKLGQAAMNRSGQSLLAPLSPAAPEAQPARVSEDFEVMEDMQPQSHQAQHHQEGYQQQLGGTGEDQSTSEEEPAEETVDEEQDSKAALRALIADAVGSDDGGGDAGGGGGGGARGDMVEIEVDLHRRQSREHSDSSGGAGDHPLIVVPPYLRPDFAPDNSLLQERSSRLVSGLVNIAVDGGGSYEPFQHDPPLNETEAAAAELALRARKACNCTKSQCLKLYCDCFANGEFCNSCNCNNCHNNLENEELRQKAIRGCLDRNPKAFRPKIGKSRAGPENFRRHNRGCNCKRSGCLKNYCECYEAKIACTNICKCVGCRNVEESLERTRRRDPPRPPPDRPRPHAPRTLPTAKQPCSFMTTEVIEAVCQCLIAAAVEGGTEKEDSLEERDPIRDVIDEFARCLQDIIGVSHQAAPITLFDEAQA